MEEMSFNEKYSKRTKELALQVIRLSSTANHKNMAVNILLRQVLRSATSVAANFRAVCRSRSDKERFAKLSVGVEESNETLFWLELIEEAGLFKAAELLQNTKKEALEILKVMSSYRKKLKP